MTPAEANGFKQPTYQAGETIFAEGDTGDLAYIVESGMIEVSRNVGEKSNPRHYRENRYLR